MVTDADYFKSHWMKPYEHINDPHTFDDMMGNSLSKIQGLRLKLTDGLCDCLFDLLVFNPHERPTLKQVIERPWVVENRKRLLALHSDIPILPRLTPVEGGGGNARNSGGGGGGHNLHITTTTTTDGETPPSDAMSSTNGGGGGGGGGSTPTPKSPSFTSRLLRSRVDAFSTKSFRFRFMSSTTNLTPIDTSTTTSERDNTTGEPYELEEEKGAGGGGGSSSGHYSMAKATSPKTPTVKKTMWMNGKQGSGKGW